MVDVLKSALAAIDGHRLHDGRSLDERRLRDSLRFVRHRTGNEESDCAGTTPYPNAAWMLQLGRNLTDEFTGFLQGKRFLIMDRDSSFHAAFRGLLEQAGTAPVRTPPNSPNCNSHIERFHGSFKRDVADRMIFIGEGHLQRSIDEYLEHYHHERNHQGLAGKIVDPDADIGSPEG